MQPHNATQRRRTDQHRPADARLDQGNTPQNQCTHDALAKIGFGDKQRAQTLGWDEQRFDITLGGAVHQCMTTGQLSDLGEKLAGPLLDHRRDVPHAIALGDRDLSRENNEHARTDFAALKQQFTWLVVTHLAKPAHAVDL